jgi:LemA protein
LQGIVPTEAVIRVGSSALSLNLPILMVAWVVSTLGLVGLWFAGSRLISRYNSLVQVEQNVDQAWSNIGVMLKQRNDELPKLLDTVSEFRDHEEDVLAEITEARQQSMQASGPKEEAEADAHVRRGLSRLFAVAEDYPELQSSENFQALQGRIADIEERIADRRELYNESVSIFNARIKQIPDILFASMLGYSEREMFEIDDGQLEDVDIEASLSEDAG